MTPPPPLPAPNPRRHDLDALRAFAMLLGIALHAALSFAPAPWTVQDSRQSGGFWLFFSAIHGFRMPLFFLLSGFFTAMLWRRRGLGALLRQRGKRVLLPCLLGLVTIVPVQIVISARAFESGYQRARQAPADNLWSAAKQGDLPALRRFLVGSAGINQIDKKLGTTSLALAAAAGHVEAVKLLLEQNADVNARNADGGTALHAAAFFGQVETAELLLAKGADALARNSAGATPLEAMQADWNVTQLVAKFLGIQINRAAMQRGRAKLTTRLQALSAARGVPIKPAAVNWVALLMFVPVFHHLWFLWFLCWLVAGFAVYAKIADWLRWRGPPRWLVLSPARYLWLVPLTMVPQAFMGVVTPGFGPETSVGILPMPQVLLYYALFFGFGALYYDAEDTTGRLGRKWWLTLPVALLVIYPLGLEFSFGVSGLREKLARPELRRPVSIALQVLYAWLMTFAMMGLFRRLLTHESRVIRYLSDASYWLYLAHLPLVIALQWLVRDWPWPAVVKFSAICLVSCLLLLLSYQWCVRHTWVGRLLNGPRERRRAAEPA